MSEWTVLSNRNGGNHYHITGDDLPQAVIRNFGRIAEDARLGNAAGYRLLDVRLVRVPDSTTSAGHKIARLVVTHVGQHLAHRPASAQPVTTTVTIWRGDDDLLDGDVAIPLGAPREG